jgi:predicted DNA-binding transcriptional regulator AlpA
MTTNLPDRLLTEQQAADRLGVATGTLRVWRCTRRYPLAWIKIGKAVRYDPREIDRFVADRTVTPSQV